MTFHILPVFAWTALCLAALLPAGLAEDVGFPGATPALDPSGVADSIFPQTSLSGNTVRINGGTILGNVGGGMTNSASDVQLNTVTINDGAIGQDVFGGWNRGGVVAGNHVLMLGGTVTGDVYGGFTSLNGAALGNEVEMYGGNVAGTLIGSRSGNTAATAHSSRVAVAGGFVGNGIVGSLNTIGTASGNIIDISGGTIRGEIIGSRSLGNGDAVFNQIYLSGSPNLTGASLFGGKSVGGGNTFSFNSLFVNGFQGSLVEANNFQFYDFVVPSSVITGQSQIQISGAIPTAMAGTSVSILAIDPTAPALHPGESFVLINKVTTDTPATINADHVFKGGLILYDFDVSTADGTLLVTLRGKEVNPSGDIVPSGRSAVVALVTHFAELVEGMAFTRVLEPEPEERRRGPSIYASATGGRLRYNSSTDTTVDGAGILAGMDWKIPNASGGVVVGPFFEAGWGNYDSTSGAAPYFGTRGKGDVSYYGGGLLAFAGLPGGWYVEASGRAGGVGNKFHSADLPGYLGEIVRYDLSHSYYGAHAGLGYLWRPSEKISLDASSKYLWLRQAGDDDRILGMPVRFDSVDTHRWRTGARLSYALGKGFSAYAGGVFEYEFGGDSHVFVERARLSAPSLQGATGIGSLGVTYSSDKWFVDAGVKGYVGKRKGITGSLRVGRDF